jgi:hypothetical protein
MDWKAMEIALFMKRRGVGIRFRWKVAEEAINKPSRFTNRRKMLLK